MTAPDTMVQLRIHAFAEMARSAVSDHEVTWGQDTVASAGVEPGIAIAAAVLTDALLSLDDRTQELLAGGPPLTGSGAEELALVSAGHQSTFAALAMLVAGVGVALPDEHSPRAVVERMATDALGIHQGYLGDCPALRWPCRLASHAAGLVTRSLGPDAVPTGSTRIEVISHFLLTEMGGLLLASAALSPDDGEYGELEGLDDLFDEETAAEPLPLTSAAPTTADVESAYGRAVRSVVASLEIAPSEVDWDTQPHTFVPGLTTPLGRLGAAAVTNDPTPPGALRELAESAASAAAGVEVHLSDRAACDAVAAVRTAIYERAMSLPRILRGPIIRHASLATLTGEVSRGAQMLTLKVPAAPNDGNVEDWQELRDRLLQLAGLAVSDVADPPGAR